MGKKWLSITILAFLLIFAGFAIYSIFNTQILRYSPIEDPSPNPLMGWAPWATIKKSEQPHTLVYADLTWREFEPREGMFDFCSLKHTISFSIGGLRESGLFFDLFWINQEKSRIWISRIGYWNE